MTVQYKGDATCRQVMEITRSAKLLE